MATHSSVFAWEIPWTEEPGGLQSVGSQQELDSTEATKQQQHSDLYPPSQCCGRVSYTVWCHVVSLP